MLHKIKVLMQNNVYCWSIILYWLVTLWPVSLPVITRLNLLLCCFINLILPDTCNGVKVKTVTKWNYSSKVQMPQHCTLVHVLSYFHHCAQTHTAATPSSKRKHTKTTSSTHIDIHKYPKIHTQIHKHTDCSDTSCSRRKHTNCKSVI